MSAERPAAKRQEYLLRITGKGVSVKRRIPGWLAAWLIRVAFEETRDA